MTACGTTLLVIAKEPLPGRVKTRLTPPYSPEEAAGLAAAFADCAGPALLVGMDTPQITPGLLAPALGPDAWQDCDAWFGPALDGGFWALGLAEPDPGLLRGVPMSRPDTGALQRARLTGAGLRVRELPPLRDVDTADDAGEVAALAPGSRFAATLARLSTTAGHPVGGGGR